MNPFSSREAAERTTQELIARSDNRVAIRARNTLDQIKSVNQDALRQLDHDWTNPELSYKTTMEYAEETVGHEYAHSGAIDVWSQRYAGGSGMFAAPRLQLPVKLGARLRDVALYAPASHDQEGITAIRGSVLYIRSKQGAAFSEHGYFCLLSAQADGKQQLSHGRIPEMGTDDSDSVLALEMYLGNRGDRPNPYDSFSRTSSLQTSDSPELGSLSDKDPEIKTAALNDMFTTVVDKRFMRRDVTTIGALVQNATVYYEVEHGLVVDTIVGELQKFIDIHANLVESSSIVRQSAQSVIDSARLAANSHDLNPFDIAKKLAPALKLSNDDKPDTELRIKPIPTGLIYDAGTPSPMPSPFDYPEYTEIFNGYQSISDDDTLNLFQTDTHMIWAQDALSEKTHTGAQIEPSPQAFPFD